MMKLDTHPLLDGLRSVRDPRGKTLAVIEALCRRPQHPPARPDPDWRPRLPTDAEIARQLGMSIRTVRSHIWTFANWIEGLEELDPRVRVYLWYWHREWVQSRACAR